MPSLANSPVLDSVPKVKDEVAVGEDMVFQRRWWLFERSVWAFFAVILVATLMGCFGRGYLAKATAISPDHAIYVKYDRIQRTGTPSDITVTLSGDAIQGGQARLFVSESLLTKIGAQRISPQPERTYVNADGVTYVFPALQASGTVIISVEPSGPGKFPFTLGLPNSPSTISRNVYVVP